MIARRCALLGMLLFGWIGWAEAVTSKQYTVLETPLKFADSAQTPDATFTLSALATGAGRISARYDRGAGAHAALYEWRCTITLTGTNVVGETVEWYIATSDGTNPDGQVGTADAALTTAKRNNLKLIGLTIVDQTASNTAMTASGWVWLPSRYLSLGTWNGTTLPFQTSTSAHTCLLTPQPLEQQ